MSDLRRATRINPCPVCRNTDWCSDSEFFTICMKVEIGSVKQTRNGGYLHLKKYDPSTTRSRRGAKTTTIHMQPTPELFGELAGRYTDAIWPSMVEGLAADLGVSAESLNRLRCGWAFDIINRRGDRHPIFDAGDAMRSCGNRGWSFPMTDHTGRVTGIRIRMESGEKFSVTGGREGLFIPTTIDPTSTGRVLIVEGATDAAAMLDLGLAVVGRPSCTGGATHLVQYLKSNRIPEVVIVADGDAPGRRGAESLACSIMPYVRGVRVIEPPDGIKDPRAWKRAGATAADVLDAIELASVRRIALRRKEPANAA